MACTTGDACYHDAPEGWWVCTEPPGHGRVHVGHYTLSSGQPEMCALWPREGEEGRFCGNRLKDRELMKDIQEYAVCTLEPGHKGNHKAVDNEGKVWREWKNNGPALPPEEAEARAWLATLEG